MYLTLMPDELIPTTASNNHAGRTQAVNTNLPQRLKEAISKTHDAIEALPLSKSIIEGRISRAEYGMLLSQLWYVHDEFECRLKACSELSEFVDRTMYRSHSIMSDLSALGLARAPIQSATRHALAAMHDTFKLSSWALLGGLYVLEGSRMGSMILVKPLSAALNVELRHGEGLNYHMEGIDTRPRVWAQFKARLSALELDEARIWHVIQGAQSMMNGLFAIYQAQAEDVLIQFPG